MAKGFKTGGRKRGSLNKTTSVLKDAILQAAEAAGGASGLEGYLKQRALDDNPGPFMALLGKVLPMQVEGNADNPVQHKVTIEFVSASK